MRQVVALVAIVFWASAGQAQEREDFATCLAGAMDRFERSLRRNPGAGDPDVALLTQRYVLICGGAGIQTCDLQEDRVTCQAALRVEQDAVTAAVLAALPAPEALEAPASHWSESLYPTLWEIAQGSSAGPDCIGQRPLLEAWCEAVEANRRLAAAVMTWQLARLLEAVPSAVDAGWVAARATPQTHPKTGLDHAYFLPHPRQFAAGLCVWRRRRIRASPMPCCRCLIAVSAT